MTGLSPRRRTDDGKRCDSRPRPLPSPSQGGNLSLYRDRKILMDLEGWSARLKVLADATRVRLLAPLEGEELTVAELSAITQLAQQRVSTHRSEEHTYEIQSLMRIPYAVFCLKEKKQTNTQKH